MATLVNRAKMTTATTGSGTITLGVAVSGYQSFAAAGVTDSQVVRYVVEDGANWEIGTGTYTSSGTTLSRTPTQSSSGGAAINLSGAAFVFITAVAADLVPFESGTPIAVTFGGTGGSDPATARTSLGLGTIATQAASAVSITGGSASLTGASSVTVNSASTAFTINQTGGGNALLVEDSTSPDSTPFIIDATGNVGIGTSTLTGLLNLYSATSASLNVSGDSGTSIVAARSSSDANSPTMNFRKFRGTTVTPAAVASGDVSGTSNYSAYDGTSVRSVAQIVGNVDTFTAFNDISGSLTFLTRPSGVAGANTERLRIGPAGQYGICGANYGTSGQTIVSGGSAAAPAWGVLPVTGGGTGVTTNTGSGAVVLGTGPTITGAALNGTVGATTPSTGVFTTLSDAAGNVRDIVNNAKTSAYVLALTDNGEMINITTGGVTVNSGIFSAGNNVTIYNNSAASQTITQGASVTLRLAGSATTGNRTLALRGICTIVCVASNEFVVSGAGVT